jgi:hypothetical protein
MWLAAWSWLALVPALAANALFLQEECAILKSAFPTWPSLSDNCCQMMGVTCTGTFFFYHVASM